MQFARFLSVGSICIILNLSILYILTDFFKVYYLLSCCIALLLVNYIGFKLNKTFTFLDGIPRARAESFWQFLRYNAVSIVSFLMGISQMYILVDVFDVWYIYANMLVAVIMAFVNFFMHKYFTYKHNAFP